MCAGGGDVAHGVCSGLVACVDVKDGWEGLAMSTRCVLSYDILARSTNMYHVLRHNSHTDVAGDLLKD